MNISSLPIARYQLTFQVTQPFELPEYSGSTIRGVFGRALRKISCMTKEDNCKECALYRTCPYTNIFETPAPETHQIQQFNQVPNGYIIEPPDWGHKQYQINEMISFNLVLFGKLIEQLPLIAFAFKRAFEYNIAGGKANLMDIAVNLQNTNTYQGILINGNIQDHSSQITLPTILPTKLILNIETPLRLQENGKPLRPNTITLPRFLISLAKRISLVSEFHHQPLNLNFEDLIASISEIKDKKSLSWQDWTRYSSRQNQKMTLGGVVGQWELDNVPTQWVTLLYIGQWLHCGKNATFGLGKYRITNL
ncbi:uncharacterized protein DUF2276 [Bisgaardia hudsonensis]|uniref:Uncharacterized protein DUF2276 n=1 Tax=Bisgaardia hudsonensis TaxID=109472 RepID=A0A4R2N149_9PAST|nr:CRISPR system precrRNA processing endoribonuclease RAMP protein Cas6 [Bisgaardia hudsonensis]QLB13189.1 CRISPR-associated protein Cas6 [Bisgaardia hudsonensis]TCP13236.1 uncharacterized protein DUF2276 [Bisgaardia hudsonensis]